MKESADISKCLTREVKVEYGDVKLTGDLTLSPDAQGLVVFAHGSGSSRHSPRNRAVARHLQTDGFATLLFDLLTEEEERTDYQTGHLRFDIPMLASRLMKVTNWAAAQEGLKDLAT